MIFILWSSCLRLVHNKTINLVLTVPWEHSKCIKDNVIQNAKSIESFKFILYNCINRIVEHDYLYKKDILIYLTILILYQNKIKFELYILQTTKLFRNCIRFPLCVLNNVYVPLNKLTNNRKIVSTCVHSSILK